MGWPTEYWNPKTGSIETYKPPVPTSPKGFPDDWKDHREGARSDFIGIKDNPLWQVAAEANDIDFASWYADAAEKIGDVGDQVWKVVTGYNYTYKQRGATARQGADVTGATPIYEEMTFNEAKERDLVDKIAGGNRWGIGIQHETILEDLNEMHGWMTKSIKAFKSSEYESLLEGPSGFDYGFDQEDLFAALGLDKAPEAPKELDVSYEMNLNKAVTSNAVYNTPEGYSKVNLHE
jgi:hypothetical protein